jgi:hypothetical protein
VDYEVYLQGSYKNDTNIRGDSDVDIVAQLNSTFYSNLSEDEKRWLGLSPATHGWSQFRVDVLRALRGHYGSDTVREGNKSIKLRAGSGRLAADIVVCAKYVKYAILRPVAEGMTFWTRQDNRQVINYPKIHYDNGVGKSFGTNRRYKPAVRVFKNARTHLVAHNTISEGLAPSYFVECLMYNVPNPNFEGSYRESFCNIVNWFVEADFKNLVCQNGQLPLFGQTPEQWSINNAKRLAQELVTLWNNW